MKLYVLFGQRKERYEGEYGPEVLVCWDEFCVDENPGGWDDACEGAQKLHASEMIATRVITITIDGDAVRRALVGDVVLRGEVKIDEPGENRR